MLGRFSFLPSMKPTSERICERGGRPWRARRGVRSWPCAATAWRALDVPPRPRVSAGLAPRHLKWLKLFKNTHLPLPTFKDGSFLAGVSGCSRVLASRRGCRPWGVIARAGLERAPCSPNLSGPPCAKISTTGQAFGAKFRSKVEAPGSWDPNVLDFT